MAGFAEDEFNLFGGFERIFDFVRVEVFEKFLDGFGVDWMLGYPFGDRAEVFVAAGLWVNLGGDWGVVAVANGACFGKVARGVGAGVEVGELPGGP